MRKLQWFENFSDEELEKIEKSVDGYYSTRNLAACLRLAMKERAEREKNPGVWDGAPEWADVLVCERNFMHSEGCGTASRVIISRYTRTLPKTKAREIAERYSAGIMDGERYVTLDRDGLPNLLESAINEALGGEK